MSLKKYKDGINIVGRNGLCILDANGTEIMNYHTPACIISGYEGVKPNNQTKYISLNTYYGTWGAVNEYWTNRGWTIGEVNINTRKDYKDVLAAYSDDYLSKDVYYWTKWKDEIYGVYETNNYSYSSKIYTSSNKPYESTDSFGAYEE